MAQKNYKTDEEMLYPPIEPFFKGNLQVSDQHCLYFEQVGNPDGIPILFVHGGPGGGISPRDRRYFDPQAYHIILFDQRGAGKSAPSFCLDDNDTWSLVEDIEKLRKFLKIDKWILFGGSWGSTLSLAYAETHVDRVLALILRGIFTLRKEEIDWFYQEGASFLFPDLWEEFVAPIPMDERNRLVDAYYKRLVGSNEEEKLRCAKAWSKWEMGTNQLFINEDTIKKADDDTWSLAFARIESHYFINAGFMKNGQLLENAQIIKENGIPVAIVQGRYDVVCPPKTAWELYKQIPNAEFYFMPDSGHSAREPAITQKLVEITDKYKKYIKL